MTCLKSEVYLEGCYQLVDLFREKSRFVLGIADQDDDLTHMQLMKIRCGGLKGMQRIMSATPGIPDVLQTIEMARQRYTELEAFPFNEIVRDIQEFSHRKRKHG